MKMNKRKAADSGTQNRKKQKREEKVTSGGDGGIDKLPDDILIAILSRMSLKDAMRTSVLSSRWKDLWRFTPPRSLEFNDRTITKKFAREFFIFSVDRFLQSTKAHTRFDSLVFRFSNTGKQNEWVASHIIGQWINFAMLKEVKRFELDLSCSYLNYKFPPLSHWRLPQSEAGWTSMRSLRSLGAFVSLTSLRLYDVHIKDEIVHYFLASCPYLEQLCIWGSSLTRNIRVVDDDDDPLLLSLKELEISKCSNLQSLVISAANLVSFIYQGRPISVPFKKVPNLTDLTIDGTLCESFIYQPNQHSSYSSQLVTLELNLQSSSVERTIVPRDLPQLHSLKKLELNIVSQVGRSLLFFVSLIKASPRLQEFKFKIEYLVGQESYYEYKVTKLMPFPQVTSVSGFEHRNLKVVEMDGYCGCESEEEFLVELSQIAPSLETVAINTDCDYYRDHPEIHFIAVYRPRKYGVTPMAEDQKGPMTPFLAKKHAYKLRSCFPSQTRFVVA